MTKAIIFDLQGTIIENGVFPSPIKQVKNILRIDRDFHEFVTIFERVFMTRTFENLSEAFITVAKEFDVPVNDFIIDKLVGIWNKNKLLAKPFPDAIPTLEELKKNYTLVLIANVDCFSKDVVEKYSLHSYFDKVLLSCDVGVLKNELMDVTVRELNAEKSDLLVVGDSLDSDMKNAELAGIRSILIDRNDRMDYPEKIHRLDELPKYL